MERPVADMFGGDIDREFLTWFDNDRVLARLVIVSPVHDIEEHAVQVDRMGHHRIIDHGQPQPLTLVELDRLLDVRKSDPVK